MRRPCEVFTLDFEAKEFSVDGDPDEVMDIDKEHCEVCAKADELQHRECPECKELAISWNACPEHDDCGGCVLCRECGYNQCHIDREPTV